MFTAQDKVKGGGASANREAAKVAMAKRYGKRSDGHSKRSGDGEQSDSDETTPTAQMW
jgi:hypothetical protein